MPDDLNPNEAADFPNVSADYVMKLLDCGELPFHMVGDHRGIALTDAVSLRDRMKARATKALDELARIDQELGLDD